MNDLPTSRPAALERMSALGDGELHDDVAVGLACREWRVDADLRASWHTYQLIGDVLRSDDLASAPARDAAFLAALRVRLAEVPVVLAPGAGDESRAAGDRADGGPADALAGALAGAPASAVVGRRRWMTPMAVAAGFVAVVGVGVLLGVPTGRDAGPGVVPEPALALAPTGGVASVSTAATPAAALPGVDRHALVASGQLIRDVRLDRYLSAHKEFAGSSALGVPSGFLRNATAEAADR